jgi:hypothetical protein
MPHRLFASTLPDQFFDTVEGLARILSRLMSRRGPVSGACKPACRLSMPIGSLQGPWRIATWSEAS